MRGTIYQRESDGRWVGVIDLPRDKGEKRQRKTVYANTKSEAEIKLNDLIYKIQNREYTKPNKDTLIGYLKEYHKICAGCNMWDSNSAKPKKAKWEETTAELYKMYIDVHFTPYFKQTKLTDIKPITLDRFYNYALSNERVNDTSHKTYKMTINTVRKLNAFLKAAFNYAIVNNQMKDNPTNHVILAKKTEFKPNVYDEERFLDLLDAVAGTDDEIPIILGAGCGFRRGEIFGLSWKDIDTKAKTITIEKTTVRFKEYKDKSPKNDTSRRTIVVPDYVIETLRLYRAKKKKLAPNDKVITRWKPGSYSERFKKLLIKFDLPLIRLHDLRHYNAVVMMNRGIPDRVAADRLGHANVTTLRKVYQHVLTDMDESAADQINSSFTRKNSHQVLKA